MSPMYPDVFDEFGDFGNIAPEASGVIGIVIGIYLIVMMFSMAYSILVYVLQSLGTYTIAKRRGIHHPWMSWFPILNAWILGSISDQYQYVVKGRVRNRRKVLLGFQIAMYALFLPVYVIAIVVGVSAGAESDAAMGAAIALLIAALLMLVISIVAMVFLYICYYDLFASCNPDNATVFLVLSILFSFLLPYFVFACRKKDLGMPPRKPQLAEAAWQPQQPVWQPPQQPTWQSPQQNAWQPPQQPTWQPQPPVQQTTWQPEAWQSPAQTEQPASTQTESEVPKTEE